MTTVEVYRGPDGLLRGFRAQGHAGAGTSGRDIVCAAVSALTQTAVNALETVAGVQTHPTVDEDAGLIECVLPQGLDAQRARTADIVLRTVRQGLMDIQTSYPRYVRVLLKEWR